MIGYIKGVVDYKDAEYVIIDNRGIGYQIRTSLRDAERVVQGDQVVFYTYLYVREDILALYGFLSREELAAFKVLLGVNGVGPKAAVSVLSAMSAEELYYAVFSDDVKALTRTPGIGPKGAKRMIMELKDKLKPENLPGLSEVPSEDKTPPAEYTAPSSLQDARDALMALGYSGQEAYRAIHSVKGAGNLSSDQLLKAALKFLM